MSSQRTWLGVLAISALLLAMATGLVAAQEPQPAGQAPLAPLGNAITYQGQVVFGQNPVNDRCDFIFTLHTAVTGGTQVGIQTRANVAVSNGLFTFTDLDFGRSVFTGEARWMEVQVRCPAGAGTYTRLAPRQALTAVPYALYSKQAPWSGVIGVPAGFADNVDNDTLGGLSCANGQIAKWNGSAWVCAVDQTGGSGAGWSLTGNAGTTPGMNFVGTTDNQALEFKVNGLRALRLVPKNVSPNIIAGYQGNAVASTAVGAAIGGGGVSGGVNQVTDSYGTVSGGQDNQAGNGDADTSNKTYSSVGGGLSNKALGQYAVISGGRENRIDPAVNWSAIGGGYQNVITTTSTVESITIGGGWQNGASGMYATISGGMQNLASGESAVIGGGVDNLASSFITTVGGGASNEATGIESTIGGGGVNRASAFASTIGGGSVNQNNGNYGTISGGETNVVSASWTTIGGGKSNSATADYTTVGGGNNNTVSGVGATICGGSQNTNSGLISTISGGSLNGASGRYSTIAGGLFNRTDAYGSSVGGGDSNYALADFATVGGGFGNLAEGQNATIPGGSQNVASADFSFAAGRRTRVLPSGIGCFVWADSTGDPFTCATPDRWAARASGGVWFYTKADLSKGVYVPVSGSTWYGQASRATQENRLPVDGQEVLAKLAEMPIAVWNDEGEDASIRHMGPAAEDFYAAFGLGGDTTHISTIDPDGVALASIQGLYKLSLEQAARIDSLESENASMKAGIVAQQQSLDDLAARIEALERTPDRAAAPLERATPWGFAGIAGLVVGGMWLSQRRRLGGGL